MSYFWGQGWLVAGIILFFLLSIGCQLVVGWFLLRLLKESKHLEEGNPRLLRGWLEQYLKEEGQIVNISAFVDKSLQDFKVGKFTLLGLKHMGGQLLLFGVFLAGIGACKGIVEGKTLGQILPFYLICLLGLYIHFSLSGVMDMEEKKGIIKTNVLDFLENHKPYLLRSSRLEKDDNREVEEKLYFGEQEEEQLKELLREILA
ncbi:MAG: hypothetical protein ACI4D2_00980 [Lachnospiraceae bacterium]